MPIPLLAELIPLVERTGLTVDHVLASQVPYRDPKTDERVLKCISLHFMDANGHEIGYWYTFYGLDVVPVDPPLEWSQSKIDQHKRIQVR